MNRRHYLTALGVGLSSSIAGCSGENEPPAPAVGDIWVEETTLKARITNAEYADQVKLKINGGRENTTVSIPEGEPIIEYKIGNRETIGTEDQELNPNAEITLTTIDDTGSERRSKTWTFSTSIELKDVIPASDIDYQPANHSQAATPVFEIKNTGAGPARLDSFVILRPGQKIPLANESGETGFAHTLIAKKPTRGRLNPIDVFEGDPYFIPAGESAQFAVDGLLTHTGPEPENVNSVSQIYTVELRSLFGTSAYQVTTELSGGIRSSEGEEEYRFENFGNSKIDSASPLKY